MEYCYEHAIPHTVFLSRWSPEDRAKTIALALERASRCPSCGTSPWEWEEDNHAYAAVKMRCEGCARKDLVRLDGDQGSAPGMSVILLPRAAAERLLSSERPRMRRRRREA